MRPHVLLVVFDTARADALEPYGPPAGSTPSVADLARRGVAVPHVFATANWTLPSHASMFTGLLPRAVGFEKSATPREPLLRHGGRMLPEVLRRAGYQTSGASTNVFVSRRFGFDIGFTRFQLVRSARRRSPNGGVRGRLRWAADAVQARIDDGMTAIDRILREWLDEGVTQPFFWFVNLMECHSPYLPPRPWNDLGPIGRYRAGRDARSYQSHEGFLRVCLSETDVAASSLERMRHLYARAVASMDDWLGRMLGALDARGILDDTLVIVTSDHGENLGEGHMLGHGISVDDRLLRVPLVAAGPGADSFDGPPGSAMAAVRSLVDLPRMIAHAIGLDEHPWTPSPIPAGFVVAQSDGMSTLTPDVAERLADTIALSPRAREELSLSRTSVTDGRFKLVRGGANERLHDLTIDPLELTDVRTTRLEDAVRLGRILDELDHTLEQADTEGRFVLAPEVAARSAGDLEAAELEERLKLLGYL